MGCPEFKFSKIPVRLPNDVQIAEGDFVPLKVDGEFFSAVFVSMGNPHCVIFTNGAVQKRVEQLGPKIETHAYFPEQTNVMLARTIDEHTVEVAHWERGSGMTLACGSGACATAAAAIRRGIASSPVTVKMRGGDLHLLWDGGRNSELWMSGPVALVYRGEYLISI
jgi:diaminopimelate epimerase